MQCLHDPQALRRWREGLEPSRRVAMVLTMGYLHEGHVALLEEARRRVPPEDGVVVLTIFVNPTQFGVSEDLERYPRDLQGDLAKARTAGVDLVFTPRDPNAMYPSLHTWVHVEELSRELCGASRPGHFRGVCTVVAKFWNLIRPDLAFFGEKDYQQLAIIRRMHADLFLSGEVVGMPIVREADGLAMSSRNARLSPQARREALAISQVLGEIRQRFAAGERSRQGLLAGVHESLHPGVVDYVSMVDASSLAGVEYATGPVLVAVAAWFGGIRLIDNVLLAGESSAAESS